MWCEGRGAALCEMDRWLGPPAQQSKLHPSQPNNPTPTQPNHHPIHIDTHFLVHPLQRRPHLQQQLPRRRQARRRAAQQGGRLAGGLTAAAGRRQVAAEGGAAVLIRQVGVPAPLKGGEQTDDGRVAHGQVLLHLVGELRGFGLVWGRREERRGSAWGRCDVV